MKNKFLKAWGVMLLPLSVAFVIARLTSIEEAARKALEFLAYSAFLITIPVLVFYVIARAFLRAHTNGEGAEGRKHGVLGCSAVKAPYVPTSYETLRKMLKMARVGPGDVVYDLGYGDGRILIIAVKDFGAKKAVGYEIREEEYRTALREADRLGLLDRIRLVKGDLFEADLSEATVIALYLNGSTNQHLKPKLERETRDGTRIVSHTYQLMGWKPTKKERVGFGTIYLYTVPEAFAMNEAGE